MNENQELSCNNNKKVFRQIKIETPKKLRIDGFISLTSKAFSFKCGDESKNKLKGISKSQSEHTKVEEFKKSLDGKYYQSECHNYIIRSLNHDIYPQKVKKSTLSLFDVKKML